MSRRLRRFGLFSVFKFARFHYSNAFVDPEIAMSALGYAHDDYQAAMNGMVAEWKRLKG